jgi:hypothetical protein
MTIDTTPEHSDTSETDEPDINEILMRDTEITIHTESENTDTSERNDFNFTSDSEDNSDAEYFEKDRDTDRSCNTTSNLVWKPTQITSNREQFQLAAEKWLAHEHRKTNITLRDYTKYCMIYFLIQTNTTTITTTDQGIHTWCQNITTKQRKIYDITYQTSCGINLQNLTHAIFMIKGIQKLQGQNNVIDKKSWETTYLPLSRATTILTLARHAVQPYKNLKKFTNIFKSVDIDTLLDEKKMFSTYIIANDSGHTYVGLIGLKGPRLASKRWREHYHETSLLTKTEMEATDGITNIPSTRTFKTWANIKYSTMHHVGIEQFFMVPLRSNITHGEQNGVKTLRSFEKILIQRFKTTLNSENTDSRFIKFKCGRKNPRNETTFNNMKTNTGKLNNIRVREPPRTRQQWHTNSPIDSQPIMKTTVFLHEPSQIKESSLYSFMMLLQTSDVLNNKNITVQTNEGNFDILQQTQLLRNFGHTRIKCEEMPPTEGKLETDLSTFLRLRKTQQKFPSTFIIMKLDFSYGIRRSAMEKTLLYCIRHPKCREMKQMRKGKRNVATLLQYYSHIKKRYSNIRSTSRKIMKAFLEKIIWAQHKLHPKVNMILKLPYRPDLRCSGLRPVIEKTVDKLNVPQEYKKYLKQNMRIVETRRENIKDWLINTRTFCKSVIMSDLPECTCNKLQQILNLPTTPGDNSEYSSNGHLAVKTSDLPEQFPLLLRSNLSNIPPVEEADYQNEARQAIVDCLTRIQPLQKLHRTKPTIQFNKQNCNILNCNNEIIGTVATARMARWYSNYMHIKKMEPLRFHQLKGTSFENDVQAMVTRYKKWINPNHWITPQEIYESFNRTMNTTTEYFSSPFDYNLKHINFCTLFEEDQLFGAVHSAFNIQWKGLGTANPHYEPNEIQKAIRWALACTEQTRPANELFGTLFVLPIWDESEKNIATVELLQHENVYTICEFEKDTFKFKPPQSAILYNKHTPLKTKTCNFKVGIYIIGNETMTQNLNLEDILTDLYSTLKKLDFCYKTLPGGICWEDIRGNQNTCDSMVFEMKTGTNTMKQWNNRKQFEPRLLMQKRTDISVIKLRSLGYLLGDKQLNERLEDTLLYLRKTTDNPQEEEHDTIEFELKRTKFLCKNLKEHGACFELDKNGQCGLIMCKRLAAQNLKTTFYEDHNHYNSPLARRITKDKIEGVPDYQWLLERWKATYTLNKWDRYTTWDNKSAIPHAYIIPKNKDIEKQRPISSYCRHPLKKLLNRAGRALTAALQNLDEQTHFTLWNTTHFSTDVQNKVERIISSGFPDVLALAGDIKNMYTELPHDHILKAVKWVLQHVEQKRRKTINVTMRGRGGARIGVSRNNEKTKSVTFTTEELLKIIEFDLQNAYFTAGDILMRQHTGIPMGSPISPILATCICAYDEHIFITKQIPLIGRTIQGTRYVDDALYMIGYDRRIAGDWAVAQWEILNMRHIYHENLNLEVDLDQLTPLMLESRLNFTPGHYGETIYNHKNADKIGNNNKNRLMKFQNYWSESNKHSKRGVIISTFLRMNWATNRGNLKLIDTYKSMLLELTTLGYPERFLRKILQSLTSRSEKRKENSHVWKKLQMYLKKKRG